MSENKNNILNESDNNKNKEKNGIFTTLSFLLSKILLPLTFIFSILFKPQAKTFKRAYDKSKEIDLKYKITFAICFVFFFSLNLHANPNTNIQLPILSEMFTVLFPHVSDGSVNDSYLSNEATVYLSLLVDSADALAKSLFGSIFLWFTVQAIISIAVDKQNINTNVVKRAVIALICLALINVRLDTEVKSDNGNQTFIASQSVIPMLFQEFMFDTILDIERHVTDLNDNLYTLPSIKVVSPENFYLEFYNFTNTYLLGNESTEEDVTEKIDTISIEYLNNEYRVEFAMGGLTNKITLLSVTALNDEANRFDIDLESKEKEFVKSYFEAMIQHSEKVGHKLANIEFTQYKNEKQTADFQNIINSSGKSYAFEGELLSYCPTIYEYDLKGSNKYVVHRFLQVASSCAAIEFFKTQYQSQFFDINEVYSNTSTLKDRHVLLVPTNTYNGVETANKYTFTELVDLTKRQCEDSYLICAELVQKISNINPEYRERLGALNGLLDVVREPLDRTIDSAAALLESRKFETSKIANVYFIDFVNENDSYADLEISLNLKQNKNMIFDNFGLLEFEHLFVPSLKETFLKMFGNDLTIPYERLATCLYYPNQVKNGFLCERITNEVINIASSTLQSAVALKVGTVAMGAIPKSNGMGGVVLGGVNKLASKAGAPANVATAIIVPLMFDSAVKENQFSTQGTIQSLLLGSYIVSFMKVDLSSALSGLATFLYTKSLATFTLVYGIIIAVWLYIFSRMFEVVIDISLFWLKAFSETVELQEYGITALVSELFIEIIYIAMLVVFAMKLPEIHDRALTFIFERQIDSLRFMSLSIENVLTGLTPFLFTTLFYILMMWGSTQFLINKLDATVEKLKQNTK
ncbi:hypothetical protein CO725_24190 [Vibrio parahaemolyticus]|uniref:hypothetical protein n=1 Tax=Vibrio parahaemolyticus TaxID=670 RepID=UPI000BE39714|nr:hypothetical protein [Vibrio parahaemolyticus]ATI48524.1 hypothetical protein CO725_24190 [Vibrio parahaemolyticus]